MKMVAMGMERKQMQGQVQRPGHFNRKQRDRCQWYLLDRDLWGQRSVFWVLENGTWYILGTQYVPNKTIKLCYYQI